MATRVRAALRDFGARKAGTPLLMASTPVRAVHPDENALSARKSEGEPGQAGLLGVHGVAGALGDRRVPEERPGRGRPR